MRESQHLLSTQIKVLLIEIPKKKLSKLSIIIVENINRDIVSPQDLSLVGFLAISKLSITQY